MFVSNLREKEVVESAGWLLFGQTCFFFFSPGLQSQLWGNHTATGAALGST